MSGASESWEELLARADLLAEKDARGAALLYQSALRQRPEHAATWCRLGHALWRLDQHDSAIQALEAALKVDPEWLDALAHLGQMHRERLDLASERLCQARLVAAIQGRVGRGTPLTPALAQAYANGLLGIGAGAAALDVLRQLDAALPGQNLWLLEAEALERLGEYERMLALYRSHLEERRQAPSPAATIFLESGWNFLSSLGDLGGRIGAFALLQQEGVYDGLRGIVRVTGTVANAAYLDCWSRHVTIVRDPSDALFRKGEAPDRRIHDTNVVALPDGTYRYIFHAFAALNARRIAAGRPPLLALDPEHAARGEAALARLGLPPGQWFVALHVRHGGYKRDHADHRKRHMNSDVMTYVPAIRAIVERGGWVVRLGDAAVPPLPAMERVIDLAVSPARSDWLDVYCLARARFLLGTGSGPTQVAASFGVPVAVANLFPVTMTGSSSQDVVWPKLLRRRDDGRLVPFADLFRPPLLEQTFADTLDRLGIDVVDNRPDELVALVEEMYARLTGTWRTSPEDDALQARYHTLAPTPAVAQVGRMCTAFLRQHEALLPHRP